MNEDQIKLFKSFVPPPVQKKEITAEPQKFRTLAQGLSFGFSDEIEAAVRSLVPESMGGKDYEVIRNELRSKLKDYKGQNPGEAITLEVAGAFLPSIAMAMTGFGAPAAAINLTRAGQLARTAKIAAVEGGVTSIGESEEPLFSGKGAEDVALGSVGGAILGTATDAVLNPAGKKSRALFDYIRRKMKGADSAVQKELLRLTEATGMTVDEIIADVASGRVIADNATLTAAIKGMVNEGGEVKPAILSASEARRLKTTAQANQSMSEALSPDVSDPNILRARAASEAEIKGERSGAYKSIYSMPESQAVTEDVANQILNIAKRSPEIRAELDANYALEGSSPLFKTLADGSIVYAKPPTLEDAEGVRRVLKDETGSLYAAGRGRRAATTGVLEQDLRTAIDTSSPDLGGARANYASMMSQNEQFQAGRKALSMNADELEILVNRLNPAELEAFRAGAMANINDKARRSGTTIENLAKEDMQLGTVLRILLPEEQMTRVVQDVSRAAEATSMDKLIQPRAQSMTQALQREAQLRGGGIAMDDVARGIGGDPLALVRMAVNMVPSGQGLSDRQMVEVAKILYTESPEIVEKVLKDKTNLGELLKKLDKIAQVVAAGSRTASAQQGSSIGQEVDVVQPLLGL
jgi:hypothetical protein